ncbi:MAG: MT-A70 family methyltransferase [Kiloniellales bacterium]|nr:MT-A70 family methyltransferase [Kiloniellales bacterium]
MVSTAVDRRVSRAGDAEQTAQHWVREIGRGWRRSVAAVLRTGRLLNEAKRRLPHGEWERLVKALLPFGPRHARRLMAIGADRRFRTHVSDLPLDILALYELTRLSDADFAAWVDDGTLRPDMSRGAVTGHVKKLRRAGREVALAGRAEAATLAAGAPRYGVLYADPPWSLAAWSEETGFDRNPANHYPVMPTAEIAALPVPAAPDAVCLLWALAEMLPDGLTVMAAWGFTYRTHLVWDKGRIGLGFWRRSRHEPLLIGTRGEVPAPAPGTQPESVIAAPPPGDQGFGAHSAKPAVFREIIEGLFPTTPKVELFCRGAPAPGWDGWGNQVSGDRCQSAPR